MPAAKADLSIEQGATYAFEIQWRNKTTLVPYDITGCTVNMQIRRAQQSDVIVDASTTNGKITIVNAVEGRIGIKLKAADTSLLAVKEALYDIEVVFPNADSDTYRILEGKVTVSPNITQAVSEPILT